MEKTEVSFLKESKEQLPREIQRLKLDPENRIDIVIKTAIEIELPEELKDIGYKPIQIVLQCEGKDVLNFNEFLPENYKFAFPGIDIRGQKIDKELSGDTFYNDPVGKLLIVPRKWKRGPKDILGLLHEIGHSLDKELPKILEKTSQWSKWIEIIDDIEKIESKTGEIPEAWIKLAQQEYLKYLESLELCSRRERFAWAKALAIVRKLKNERGIDLLKPFRGKTAEKTRKNLEEYIHGAAGLGYAEKWDVMGSQLSEELKGIFTTKIYRGEKFTPEHRKKIRG